MGTSLEERVGRALADRVEVVSYDSRWPARFREECTRLRNWLPAHLVGRIEHFGSTAVPGLDAKPIVDMLIEVTSLEETRRRIVPILEERGYDYFWRPVFGEEPPFYAWFVRRDVAGRRTHHLHMVEADSELWDRLRFRDLLINNPTVARRYGDLKRDLARRHPHDRMAYTLGKSAFINRVMAGL